MPDSGWVNPNPNAPTFIETGVAVGAPNAATTARATNNPFETNYTGVQRGTGEGTGYAAVNYKDGKVAANQNPWTQFTDVTDATKTAQSNVQNLQGQLKDAQNDYPAMQNTYGLGGPVAPAQAGSDSNPSYDSKPITSDAGSSGSRGFNPWSLQGEATARNSWG